MATKIPSMIEKHVVSSTLTKDDLTWTNTNLIPADGVLDAIRALKSREAGDLQVMGSLTLARWRQAAVPGRWPSASDAPRIEHCHRDGRAGLQVPRRCTAGETILIRMIRMRELMIDPITTHGLRAAWLLWHDGGELGCDAMAAGRSVGGRSQSGVRVGGRHFLKFSR